MTASRTALHASFTIERLYDAAPARVFAAWGDQALKRRWFACHPDWSTEHVLDFRVGGRETIRTGPGVGSGIGSAGGTVHLCEALYHDIVPDRRIVYSYAMHLDDRRISVSLVTLEFRPVLAGTMQVLTEQGAFLDGWEDVKGREEGTRIGLDGLAAVLRQLAA
jgi:uncharacterized protein YndB with AHSA1/START domain